MKDYPILFNGPMVRAVLDGSKTQTRRVIARPLQHPNWTGYFYFGPSKNNPTCQSMAIECGPDYPDGPEDKVLCPYGGAGDRLWVRETFFAFGRWETRYSEKKRRDEWHFIDMTLECDRAYQYAADSPDVPLAKGRGAMPGWWKRPAIFMPRAVSRICRDVVSVRVERLNDISEEDARAEGVLFDHMGWMDYAHNDGRRKSSSRQSYQTLCESINGPGSWSANPFVWAVEVKRLLP